MGILLPLGESPPPAGAAIEVTRFSLGLSVPALPLPSLWWACVFLVTSAPLAELAPAGSWPGASAFQGDCSLFAPFITGLKASWASPQGPSSFSVIGETVQLKEVLSGNVNQTWGWESL